MFFADWNRLGCLPSSVRIYTSLEIPQSTWKFQLLALTPWINLQLTSRCQPETNIHLWLPFSIAQLRRIFAASFWWRSLWEETVKAFLANVQQVWSMDLGKDSKTNHHTVLHLTFTNQVEEIAFYELVCCHPVSNIVHNPIPIGLVFHDLTQVWSFAL